MGLSKDHLAQIDSLLQQKNINSVFGILQQYTDLRHTDLPPVSKKQLQQISADQTALRDMVLGVASPSESVRRFCKKYAPKLGPVAAAPVLFLAVESIDPFRPAPGLLGDFGGYSSPVGQHIKERKMKTTVKSPHVYSEAGKYAKEVVGMAVDVFASLRPEWLVYLKEFSEAFARAPIDNEDWPERKWEGAEFFMTNPNRPGSDYLYGEFYSKVHDLLFKYADQQWLFDAAKMWAEARLLIEQDPFQEEALRPFRDRFKSLRETDKIVTRRRGRYFAGRLLLASPKEQRIAIYSLLQSELKSGSVPASEARWVEESIKRYVQKHPGEADTKEFEKEQARKRKEQEIASKKRTLENKEMLEALGLSVEEIEEEVEELQKGEESSVEAESGIEAQNLLYKLADLAETLGLPGVWKKINSDARMGILAGPKPEPSKSATARHDENLLETVREFIKAERKGKILPNAAIAKAGFGEQLLGLLERAAIPWIEALAKEGEPTDINEDYTRAQKLYFDVITHLETPLLVALSLLSDDQLRRWAEFWNARVHLRFIHFFSDTINPIVDTVEARDIKPTDLLKPMLSDPWKGVAGNEPWQRLVAILYQRGERETVYEILQSIPFPDGTEYYKRSDWNEPFQWLLSEAWRRQDARLLAIALERCALPFYKQGSNVLLPITPHLRKDGYAPRTRIADDAFSMEDVWKLTREKESARVPVILQNAFRLAEIESLPRFILRIGAADLAEADAEQVLALLESSQPAVVQTGIAVIANNPAIVSSRVREVLRALEPAVVSTSGGVAKGAAELLAVLAATYPECASAALGLLGRTLSYENPPAQEQALKSIKKIGLRPSNEVVKRIAELSENNPRRFRKLADQILQRK